jgi:hypothetical protein
VVERYIVLEASGFQELAARVNELLMLGYEPLGPPAVVGDGWNVQTWAYQAMYQKGGE